MAQQKLLSDTYVSDRINVSEDDAIKELVDCTMTIASTLREKKEDEQLESARSIVKDLSSGYNSVIKHEKAKIEFLLGKIEEARLLASI